MIDIVVPVFNEGDNVKKLFDQISSEIAVDKRVIIVYDFDEDTTIDAVLSLRDNYNFVTELVKNKWDRGALNAIKTGLLETTSEAVLITMADLSDSLSCVDSMYDLVQNGYDIICGSRYMKGGKQIGGPLLKKILSRVAGVSLHYLVGIPTHDVTNSFKMYTRKVLKSIEIESLGGFELGMELTVKSFVYGFKITEVPSTWYDRVTGTSNFKMWSWIPRYLHWYFYAIRHVWFSKRGKAL